MKVRPQADYKQTFKREFYDYLPKVEPEPAKILRQEEMVSKHGILEFKEDGTIVSPSHDVSRKSFYRFF